MEESILKRIIVENQERIPNLKVFDRNYSFEESANYILTGQRRAGKTFLLYHRIQQLLKQGIDAVEILYINFEDERLLEFKIDHFDLLIESYKDLYSNKPYIFLDEIQNIAGWEKFARRLSDSDFLIYITGSNAVMLSNELATTLGGRFLVKEIDTLTFVEFLSFNNFEISKNIEYSDKRFELKRLFNDWFKFGGFPELLKFQDKREYLNSIFLKVFLGDIISRYELRNKFALQVILKKLAESATDEISYNRIRHIVQSTGVKIGTATVIEYIGLLEESFLIKSIKNYHSKMTDKETKKKYYFRDHGLLSLFLNEPSSLSLETLVFTHLNHIYPNRIFFLREKYEVDFFVPDENQLIQVCFNLNEINTREREINALLHANKSYKSNKLTIITIDNEEEFLNLDGVTIHILPAWKWLLNREKQ